jgi:hypothetical protein
VPDNPRPQRGHIRGPNLESRLSHDRYSPRQRHHEVDTTPSSKPASRDRHPRLRPVDDMPLLMMLDAWLRTVSPEHMHKATSAGLACLPYARPVPIAGASCRIGTNV